MSEKIEIVAELKDLISGKFKEINSQIDAMDSKLSHIRGSGTGGGIMGSVLGANLLTQAIMSSAGAVKQFAVDSFNAYGKQEQFQTALTTLLYGNTEQAEALNNQLKGFALETPFELSEIQQATRLMIAYGSTAGGVVDEMRMLGDVSAGTGQSLGEVAYLYGTMRQQGKANLIDLRQLANRGIPIFKELAKVTKYSLDQLVEGGKDVDVTFKDIERAFKNMTASGSQFGGMMGEQAKTLLGQTSNLADAWDQLHASIGRSQQGILKGTIQWATDMVKGAGTFFDTHNSMGDAFKKHGAEQFDFKQKVGSKFIDMLNNIPGVKIHSKVNDAEMLHDNLQNMYVKDIKTPMDAINSEKHLRGLLQAQFKSYMRGIEIQNMPENERSIIKEYGGDMGIDKQEYSRNQAIIRGAIEQVQGIKELLRSKSADPATGAKIAEKKPKDLETLARQNRATQVNVTIENLVRELSNYVGSPKEALELTASQIARVFTGAVNDVHTVGQ